MKRLLLIPLVLFLACEDMGKDCAGEENGTAQEDSCGVCDNDATNDCVKDCNGDWGGNAVLDGCGVCNGDNSSCSGCIDSTAYNYDSLAVVSDNSCIFLPNCNDGIDNDCDELTDYYDSESCGPNGTGEIPLPLPELPYDCDLFLITCNDGIDNDEDGLIDSDDPDCDYCIGAGEGACTIIPQDPPPDPPPLPYCNDGIDNDFDGLIDLEDVYDCIADSGGVGEFPPPPSLPE